VKVATRGAAISLEGSVGLAFLFSDLMSISEPYYEKYVDDYKLKHPDSKLQQSSDFIQTNFKFPRYLQQKSQIKLNGINLTF